MASRPPARIIHSSDRAHAYTLASRLKAGQLRSRMIAAQRPYQDSPLARSVIKALVVMLGAAVLLVWGSATGMAALALAGQLAPLAELAGWIGPWFA